MAAEVRYRTFLMRASAVVLYVLDRQPEFREQADNFFGSLDWQLIGEIPDSVFLLIWQRTQAQQC